MRANVKLYNLFKKMKNMILGLLKIIAIGTFSVVLCFWAADMLDRWRDDKQADDGDFGGI